MIVRISFLSQINNRKYCNITRPQGDAIKIHQAKTSQCTSLKTGKTSHFGEINSIHDAYWIIKYKICVVFICVIAWGSPFLCCAAMTIFSTRIYFVFFPGNFSFTINKAHCWRVSWGSGGDCKLLRWTYGNISLRADVPWTLVQSEIDTPMVLVSCTI